MSSDAPNPVTDDSGETVAYKCPECGTRRFTEEKAEKCCSASVSEDKTAGVDAGKTPSQNGYYQRDGIEDVSHAHGRLDIDGLPAAQCLGVHDNYGWYQDRPETDPDTIQDGFDGRGSVYALADDYGELSRNIERVLYATTNYQHLDGRDWLLFSRDESNSKDWKDDESPMPDYEDILGFSILADIDLEDEHKERPLPAGTRETVERAIDEYATAFAALVGGRWRVFALDSVGGAYLLTPPAATAPIAKAFDGDDRARILKALRKRADEWLDNEREKVNATVAGTEGVFDADLLNQSNRQYKAPLSIHKSIDGVVHPLDIEDGEPSYEFVPVEDADTVVDETVVWATEFTHAKHAEAVDEIVSSLWPEYADECDGWKDALEAWLSDEREAERERQRKEQQAIAERERRREERDDDLPAFTAAIADGAEFGITTAYADIQAAVDDIPAKEVVRKLCDEYDTDPGRDPPRFEPGYRTSDSGTSCFVDREKIHDINDPYDGIGVLDYVARENDYIGETETATNDTRAKARDDLRELGYEIPVWTPAKGSTTYDGDEFEEMPSWALVKAAVVLGVCEPDDVTDGWKLPRKVHDALLRILDGQGIDHGHDLLDAATTKPVLDEGDSDDTTSARGRLTPAAVKAEAGLGENDSIADLKKWQKAACVWELIEHNDDVHVRVRRDNGSVWAYDGGIWKPEGDRALRHAGRRALGAMNYHKKVLTEMKAQARSDPRAEVEQDEFGLDTGTVAVENGLVNLSMAANGGGDDALRDLRPDDHALTRLPVEYDPNAEYDEWQAYVEEWAEDGKADALQEYVGYCLHIGALPIHRALLLVGSGSNGKGTFLKVVRTMLGDDEPHQNISSIELQTLANEKDAVADMYGSLANIDDDLSTRKLGQGKGMFKKLVAGDRVRARALYESGFEYDATTKHLYAANEVPKVDVPDNDEAFWRRWLLVEFPNFYPPNERDTGLRDRLTEPESLSGVLNWAIDGWQRLLDQGYFTDEEQLAHDKRRRWQSWGDSVDEFISECVERDDDAPRMTTGEAHARYVAWCDDQDDTDAVKQQPFTVRLKAENVGYGRLRIDGKSQRGYDALGLSDDVPDSNDSDDPTDSTQERL